MFIILHDTSKSFMKPEYCYSEYYHDTSIQLNNNPYIKKKKKNFMAPFHGWGSTASRLKPLRGDSLLFTTKSPEIPGTHFIDLGRTKG